MISNDDGHKVSIKEEGVEIYHIAFESQDGSEENAKEIKRTGEGVFISILCISFHKAYAFETFRENRHGTFKGRHCLFMLTVL